MADRQMRPGRKTGLGFSSPKESPELSLSLPPLELTGEARVAATLTRVLATTYARVSEQVGTGP